MKHSFASSPHVLGAAGMRRCDEWWADRSGREFHPLYSTLTRAPAPSPQDSWALGRASLPLHRSRQTEELARRSPAFIRRGLIEGFRDGVGSARRSGSLSVLVDLALRELREGIVRLLFLSERCFQQLHSLI